MVSDVEAFRESVLRTLFDLKQPRDGRHGRMIKVPLGDRAALVLRPVIPGTDLVSDRDVDLITAWRNQHRESFLTWFTATSAGTRRWLEEMRETGDRILFMIESDGTAFGHAGVRSFDFRARTCEVDCVARGRHEGPPGGMTVALRGLLTWLFEQLHCAEIFVRVFADNWSALALYERCGFRVVRTVSIEPVAANGIVQWAERPDTESDSSTRRLAYMTVSAPASSARVCTP